MGQETYSKIIVYKKNSKSCNRSVHTDPGNTKGIIWEKSEVTHIDKNCNYIVNVKRQKRKFWQKYPINHKKTKTTHKIISEVLAETLQIGKIRKHIWMTKKKLFIQEYLIFQNCWYVSTERSEDFPTSIWLRELIASGIVLEEMLKKLSSYIKDANKVIK